MFQENNSFLLLGEQRSGTNWLKAVLDSHPDIRLLMEPLLLHNGGSFEENPLHHMRFSDADKKQPGILHTGLETNPYGQTITKSIIDWLLTDDGRVKGIKEVDMAFHLGWLLSCLPAIKIIRINRDLRGNVASYLKDGLLKAWGLEKKFELMLQTIRANPELESLYGSLFSTRSTLLPDHQKIALLFAVAKAETDRNLSKQHGKVLRVGYEELVSNPFDTLDLVLNFLKVSFSQQTASYLHETVSQSRAEGTYNIHRAKVGENGALDFVNHLTPSQAADVESIAREFGISLIEIPKKLYALQPEYLKKEKPEPQFEFVATAERETLSKELKSTAIEIPELNLKFGETLVTNEQFAHFLTWLHEKGIPIERSGFNLFYNKRAKDEIKPIEHGIFSIKQPDVQKPVVHVNYFAARAFAAWLGGRLPTFEEWQKASFSAEQLKNKNFVPNKDSINAGDFFPGTTPVKQFSPNQRGVYDWAGNVSVWLDEPYLAPNGTVSPIEQIVAGGAWSHELEEAAPDFRRDRIWSQPASTIGIRVVWDNDAEILPELAFEKKLRFAVFKLTSNQEITTQKINQLI
jgi:formylglycine-generating enzyme required for sulfatase activity